MRACCEPRVYAKRFGRWEVRRCGRSFVCWGTCRGWAQWEQGLRWIWTRQGCEIRCVVCVCAFSGARVDVSLNVIILVVLLCWDWRTLSSISASLRSSKSAYGSIWLSYVDWSGIEWDAMEDENSEEVMVCGSKCCKSCSCEAKDVEVWYVCAAISSLYHYKEILRVLRGLLLAPHCVLLLVRRSSWWSSCRYISSFSCTSSKRQLTDRFADCVVMYQRN